MCVTRSAPQFYLKNRYCQFFMYTVPKPTMPARYRIFAFTAFTGTWYKFRHDVTLPDRDSSLSRKLDFRQSEDAKKEIKSPLWLSF